MHARRSRNRSGILFVVEDGGSSVEDLAALAAAPVPDELCAAVGFSTWKIAGRDNMKTEDDREVLYNARSQLSPCIRAFEKHDDQIAELYCTVQYCMSSHAVWWHAK